MRPEGSGTSPKEKRKKKVNLMTNQHQTVSLFSPVTVGPYTLPNRIVMSPMTRNRAGAGNVPGDAAALYYAQRSSAGLIVTEATQVSPQGVGYPMTPGIHSSEQVQGWKNVVSAVHEKGGRIFLQLFHCGRISHPSLQPNGQLPVAPSAITPEGQSFTSQGLLPYVTPRALETTELAHIVEQFRNAASNALLAGFDGVELHSANGYLLDQFLETGTNQRTDEYGGPVENRARLLLEVTQAVTEVWGANRLGVRISPGGSFNSMRDSDPARTFKFVAEALNPLGLAYLHVIEPMPPDEVRVNGSPVSVTSYLRSIYRGTLITAQNYNYESGSAVLARGDSDLVAYGKLFIANPDLPRRFALKSPLNTPDPSSFYGGDARGYTDYPTLEEQASSA